MSQQMRPMMPVMMSSSGGYGRPAAAAMPSFSGQTYRPMNDADLNKQIADAAAERGRAHKKELEQIEYDRSLSPEERTLKYMRAIEANAAMRGGPSPENRIRDLISTFGGTAVPNYFGYTGQAADMLGNVAANQASAITPEAFRAATADQSTFRADQIAAISQMRNLASGAMPSEAVMLLEQQRKKNANDALSIAASMPGVNPALAQRMAQDAIVKGNAQTSADAAIQRAREQAQAIGMFYDASAGARGQDESLAMNNAANRQQANMYAADSRMQSQLANQDIRNQELMRQMQLAEMYNSLGQQGMGNLFQALGVNMGMTELDQGQQQLDKTPGAGWQKANMIMGPIAGLAGGIFSGAGGLAARFGGNAVKNASKAAGG